MALNLNNLQSYGDTLQRVYTAALGVTPPAAYPAAYPAGWYDIGWIDAANGLQESINQNENKKYGWQGNALIGVLRSQFEHPFTFTALEENAVVQSLKNPSGYAASTTTGGVAEVQTVTITGTGTAGTWTLTLPTYGTASGLAYNIATSALITAIQSAFGITTTISGTPGSSYVITFPTALGNVPQMTATQNITGATAIAVATTTPGVNGSNVTPVMPAVTRNLRQFGIDLISGGITHRLLFGSAEAVQSGNTTYKGDEFTAVDFTLNPFLVNGAFFTDLNSNPALAAGLVV